MERAALEQLFFVREHDARVVLWDGTAPGLVLGSRVARPDPALIAMLPHPVELVASTDVARLFARHPDAWRAFYAAHPGAGGIVELAQPWITPDSAAVDVARSCGEHCRSLWRVDLGIDAGSGDWVVRRVTPLRLAGE